MSEEADYISVLLNTQHPQIREEAFKERYLPLLFSPDPFLFNIGWINDVAQSPYLEVDIINKKNEVVFVVPPLRKQVKATTDQSLPYVANLAQMESRIHVMKGHMVLEQHLPNLIKFNGERDVEIERRWRELITYYGHADKLSQTSNPELKASSEGLIIMDEDDESW